MKYQYEYCYFIVSLYEIATLKLECYIDCSILFDQPDFM